MEISSCSTHDQGVTHQNPPVIFCFIFAV